MSFYQQWRCLIKLLKFGHNCMFQQDSNLKHTLKEKLKGSYMLSDWPPLNTDWWTNPEVSTMTKTTQKKLNYTSSTKKKSQISRQNLVRNLVIAAKVMWLKYNLLRVILPNISCIFQYACIILLKSESGKFTEQFSLCMPISFQSQGSCKHIMKTPKISKIFWLMMRI